MTDGTRIDWADLRRRIEAAGDALATAGAPSPEITAQVLRERARRLAQPEDAVGNEPTLELIGFVRAGERWAIGARHVLAVVPAGPVTPLPAAGSDIAGVMAWRGHPLVLRDVATKPAGLDGAWAVVLGDRTPAFALLADATPELLLLPRSQMGEANSTTASDRPWLLGVTAEARLVIDGAALLQDQMGDLT